MSNAPNLLNDDGSASMATALMMSHHAFRRDLARFARALETFDASDAPKLAAMRKEWQWFHGAIHGHHESEDTRIFPPIRSEHPELSSCIDRLSAEHRQIDPLLGQGDRAFGETFDPDGARATIASLRTLLDPHLALEEAQIVPQLRGTKELPAPTN